MSVASHSSEGVDPKDVLTKAVSNAAKELGLSRDDLAAVIGRDRSSLSRNGIDPQSKAGELGLLVVRIYRALFVLVGDDQGAMKHWMNTENRYFNSAPRERIKKVDGLVRVVEYLDAMRGKV